MDEFGKMAKTNNTIIMPADVSNVNHMIVQVKFNSKTFMILYQSNNNYVFIKGAFYLQEYKSSL